MMNLDFITTIMSYMITIGLSSWTLYEYYTADSKDKDTVSKLFDLMILSYVFLFVSILCVVLITNIGYTFMYFALSILLVLIQTGYTTYQILNIEKKIEKDKLYNFLMTNILFFSLIFIILMYEFITYFNTKNTMQQYGQQTQKYPQQSQYGQQPYYGQQQPYYGQYYGQQQQPYYGQYYGQQQTPPPQVIVVQTPPAAAAPAIATVPQLAAAASTKTKYKLF